MCGSTEYFSSISFWRKSSLFSQVDSLTLPTGTSATMSRHNSDLSSVNSAEVSPTLERGHNPWPRSIIDSGVDGSVTLLHEQQLRAGSLLPPPQDLGDGNPFLLFVCLSILLAHRQTILTSEMKHHFELAMHFDKMIKRHHLSKTLVQARSMFADYLKAQQREQQLREEEVGPDEAHLFWPVELSLLSRFFFALSLSFLSFYALIGSTMRNREHALFGSTIRNREHALFGSTMRNREHALIGSTMRNREHALFGSTIRNREHTLFGSTMRNREHAFFGSVMGKP